MGSSTTKPLETLHWGIIVSIIDKVLDEGNQKVYKNGPAFINSLNINGQVVEVIYRVINGIKRISDAWVK